jgi:hypothetical protein
MRIEAGTRADRVLAVIVFLAVVSVLFSAAIPTFS